MKKIKETYSVLTYQGVLVDKMKLGQGFYSVIVPELHREDDTIEEMIRIYESFKSLDSDFVTEGFLNNLKECKLQKVTLTLAK